MIKKSAAYYFGTTRPNVFISQFSHAHITHIEWTDVCYVPLRGKCDGGGITHDPPGGAALGCAGYIWTETPNLGELGVSTDLVLTFF